MVGGRAGEEMRSGRLAERLLRGQPLARLFNLLEFIFPHRSLSLVFPGCYSWLFPC